ncbi:hypothetical protein JSE7799_00339 [Jannaschia seosinensis]|uniref:Beta-barrel assembly machine subunit BamF n=1 Tax=Jannaschia seosinensis TaxID=313367 RepID=A0A0M7B761_9RHOB|nr:DUF3035 domain-containing protein [Jannaschia seosinensis]CUH16066.1 hypothetical protein JSE7799_00339 [Jannaschia seosinensis]
MTGRFCMAAALALGLVGCGGGEPDLLTLRKADSTPDEFSILPTRPLQSPPPGAGLPPPTRGGGNRADPAPQAEAIASLGGNPAAGAQGDGALIATATRYGLSDNIRGQLAAEDLAFRRANDGLLLERLFDLNVYYRAYQVQALDQYAELERLRRFGVRTVAAPPDPATLD